MFFDTSPELWEKLKPLARQMRQTPTTAENTLWQSIRNRAVNNAKFRRQYAIERFIVDFVCLEMKLIIEVDGSIHDYQQGQDAVRQEYLEALGFNVVRFQNHDVLHSIDAVLTVIHEALLEAAKLTIQAGSDTSHEKTYPVDNKHPSPPLQNGEGAGG